MSIKKRGLNRGLDALLSSANINKNNSNTTIYNNISKQNINSETISQLNINQLIAGQFQPRKTFDMEEISELVESIKNQGILQPLIVRNLNATALQKKDLNNQNNNTTQENTYEIIAGERRFRAATIAGLNEVPVIIKNVNNKDALTIALIENIQRENLNPLEEATALDRLIKEFDLTHNQVATAIGKSRTVITNLLRILQLPYEIKKMLEKNQLELGHAKVLLSAPYEIQLKVAHNIVAKNLSVRATEEILKKLQNNNSSNTLIDNVVNNNIKIDISAQKSNIDNKFTKNSSNGYQFIDPDISRLQKKLSELLGAKTIIETSKKGKNKDNKINKGKLIIEYNSLEELDGILEKFFVEAING